MLTVHHIQNLMIADKLGFRNDEIMFSSNETPAGEFKYCDDLGGIINLR